MHEAETRALRHAVVVLLALSALRWGSSALRPSAEIPGADVLPTLIAGSDSALKDATERARALAPGERIDPNHATAPELDRLPGVGPGTASAIVREREAHGPYRSGADLARVPGLGAGTVKKMLPHLRVGAAPPRSAGVRSRRPAAPVDVNHADEQTLQTLPGVGPALARRIVEARKQKPFTSVNDLTRVSGIGPATVKRLRGRVTVHR